MNVHLELEAVNASSHAFNAGLHVPQFIKHRVFMLLYASTSRSSFDKVEELIRQVKYIKDSFDDPPIMLVGLHNDELDERRVSESEGYALAERYDISFRAIDETRVESLHDTFFQLVRQMWAWEAQRYPLRPPPPPPVPLPSPLSKAKTELNNIALKPRRRNFLRRMTENDRLHVLTQPGLSAIQEV